jgi:hypothetical protein
VFIEVKGMDIMQQNVKKINNKTHISMIAHDAKIMNVCDIIQIT